MLFRSIFWIAVAVLLLPTEEKSQAKLLSQGQAALHWTWTFCDRNPTVCQKGAEAWAVFLKKAEFGAALATNMLREWSEKQAGEAGRVAPAAAPAAPVTQPQPQPIQHLKREDMLPPWRGKTPDKTGA